MKARSERDLQQAILKLLSYHHTTAIQSRMDTRTSNNVGTPDFLFAVKGQAVAWEAKLRGQRCRLSQLLMHQRLLANGWRVAVIHSIDEAVKELESLELETKGARR